MKKYLLAAVAVAFAAATGFAHMVMVVPAKDGKAVTVVFSDNLEPDENVPIEKIAGLKLHAVAGGKVTAVEHKTDKHALTAALPADAKVVFGSVTYGAVREGQAEPAGVPPEGGARRGDRARTPPRPRRRSPSWCRWPTAGR